MSDPEWICPSVVWRIHEEQLREHGGIPGIRESGLLEAALFRAQQRWAYRTEVDGHGIDLCELAACYAFGLTQNHPFFDGNKRTAAICCELFLLLNGSEFSISEMEKYPAYLALAAGDWGEVEFAEWLRQVTRSRKGRA